MLPPSSRRQADAHRASAFRWVRVHFFITNKKEEAFASSFVLVPVTGLEPVRCRQRRILSPLRLPFHHTGRCNIFSYATYALRECRCPVAVPEISCSLFAHEISTAAHRSGRFLRHRRRSLRSPDSHPYAVRQRRILSPLRLLFSHTGRCFVLCDTTLHTV